MVAAGYKYLNLGAKMDSGRSLPMNGAPRHTRLLHRFMTGLFVQTTSSTTPLQARAPGGGGAMNYFARAHALHSRQKWDTPQSLLWEVVFCGLLRRQRARARHSTFHAAHLRVQFLAEKRGSAARLTPFRVDSGPPYFYHSAPAVLTLPHWVLLGGRYWGLTPPHGAPPATRRHHHPHHLRATPAGSSWTFTARRICHMPATSPLHYQEQH